MSIMYLDFLLSQLGSDVVIPCLDMLGRILGFYSGQ